SERAQLSMAPGESYMGAHTRQEDLTEALAPLRRVGSCHALPKAVDGPPIVALGLVGNAQVLVRQGLQGDLPTGRREREGALGSGDGLVIGTHTVKMGCQPARDLSQPTWVVEGLGEGLGLAQHRQNTPQVARRSERRAQDEPEINGLLARITCLRQMREGAECLLEGLHSLTE